MIPTQEDDSANVNDDDGDISGIALPLWQYEEEIPGVRPFWLTQFNAIKRGLHCLR